MKNISNKSREKILEITEKFEAVLKVKEGLAQAERGEGISLAQFDKHMRQKHGISR